MTDNKVTWNIILTRQWNHDIHMMETEKVESPFLFCAANQFYFVA